MYGKYVLPFIFCFFSILSMQKTTFMMLYLLYFDYMEFKHPGFRKSYLFCLTETLKDG